MIMIVTRRKDEGTDNEIKYEKNALTNGMK